MATAPANRDRISLRMDDVYELVLAMLTLVIAAAMLVAGELYLVTRPDPPEITTPRSVVISSVNL
ncbi:hypothetical protein J2W51_001580 [Tardiphaga robiniae]|nr:hypothetical protein [Tardiphaga robiniae]